MKNWDDNKWFISWGIILVSLGLLLVTISYTLGNIVGDTRATRECIEKINNRKY